MKLFKGILIILSMFFTNAVLFSSESWSRDWKSAVKESSKLKKPILMDFYTDWCPPCKKLSEVTFKDKKVLDYFNKNRFILIRVNPEKDREAEAHFKVYSYPTLILFNEKGDEIARILGYLAPDRFIKDVSDLRKGIGTLKYLLGKYKKDDKNIDLINKIVNKYTSRAFYPNALELLDKIIKMDSDNLKGKASKALFMKGYIYYKWKKYRRSIEILTSIRKIFPKSKDAENGLGAAAEYSRKLNDKKLTVTLLEEFLKEFPKSKYADEYKKLLEKVKK